MTTPEIRRISLAVECKLCGAYPGERCMGYSGQRARDPHLNRIRAAHQEDPE